MKLDYLLSSSLSVVMHGALAAGLYGSMVSGPSISFAPGNAGIAVSITTPSELGWMNAESAAIHSQSPITPTRLILPEPKPEVSIAKPRVEKSPEIRKPTPVKLVHRQESPPPTAAQSEVPVTSEVSPPCASQDCGTRASLGFSGDAGSAGAGVVHAPKPPYPWEARRAGFEGSLVVTVDISKDGSVKDAVLAQSSGRADCDRAALETIRERWRFEPARFRGQPIDWREKVVVVYSLRQ